MKELGTVARLLHLRRRREQRALEAVAAEMQRLLPAEQAVEAAATALRRHDELVDERELVLLAPLVGRAVPHSDIMRLRGALDVLAIGRARLDAGRRDAEAALHRQRELLEAARAAFLARRRAVMKIDGLFAREAAQRARRDEAAAEGGDSPQA
jgi:hypothetical protein